MTDRSAAVHTSLRRAGEHDAFQLEQTLPGSRQWLRSQVRLPGETRVKRKAETTPLYMQS